MSFSAPISLGLFLAFLYTVTLLRGIPIPPVNTLLVAGTFFCFNLLFSYTADRVPIELAFAISSVVSVGMVVSYLYIVVGPRVALVEAAIAQVLYQVGFAAAHFAEGYTGLSITVLAVITLFVVMQLTARVRWGSRAARA